jgi:hypothetical protein
MIDTPILQNQSHLLLTSDIAQNVCVKYQCLQKNVLIVLPIYKNMFIPRFVSSKTL